MTDHHLATPRHETRRRRPSLVWLMPLLAIAVAGGVVWKNYADQGPLITITFPSAAGIRAAATELRIRDLRVGVVEAVGFTDGMEAVEAHVRVDKNVARYIDSDARFWLVQPQVSARGVTGIGTILSGVYIAASWDGEPGTSQTEFAALETPPLTTFGEEGTRIVLRTRAGGQLAAGAPVLASGIEVGRIGQPVLSATGSTVTMDAFIAAPYDQRLTTNARFWDASGLSVNVGAAGLSVKVDSLAALIEGGINFGTPVTGGDPVADGFVYEVFASEAAARADAFEAGSDPEIAASILLDSDVSGLGVGTLVRFRGVKVGEVRDLAGVASPEGSDEPVRLRIDMGLAPERIGLPPRLSGDALTAALASRVEDGLRVRLAKEGLFGQTTILEVVDVADAPEATIEIADGRTMLPTVAEAKSDGESGIEGLVTRVSNLPIEALMTAATEALGGVSRVAVQAESVLASEGIGKIPETLDGTLTEIGSLICRDPRGRGDRKPEHHAAGGGEHARIDRRGGARPADAGAAARRGGERAAGGGLRLFARLALLRRPPRCAARGIRRRGGVPLARPYARTKSQFSDYRPLVMRILALFLPLLLAGCLSGQAPRFAVEPVPSTVKVRTSASTIELADVTLPNYATENWLTVQDEAGALVPLRDADWADEPSRAMTFALVRHLSEITGAKVAADPWPLAGIPEAEVRVRVEQMIADTTGHDDPHRPVLDPPRP